MKNEKCREIGKTGLQVVRYAVICEQMYCEELFRTYRSYGIVVRKNGRVIKRVSDVSTDKRAVTELVRRCNEYSLDPVHLSDVIEDLLSE